LTGASEEIWLARSACGISVNYSAPAQPRGQFHAKRIPRDGSCFPTHEAMRLPHGWDTHIVVMREARRLAYLTRLATISSVVKSPTLCPSNQKARSTLHDAVILFESGTAREYLVRVPFEN
jgi:hypothetical protein